jgi:hypothetical protein
MVWVLMIPKAETYAQIADVPSPIEHLSSFSIQRLVLK